MEPLRLLACSLSQCCINHQPAVIRFEQIIDLHNLFNEIILQCMTTGRIHNNNFDILECRKTVTGNLHRVFLFGITITGNIDLFAQSFQLCIGTRPEVISTNCSNLQSFSLEVTTKFSGCCCFTRTLKTCHQNFLGTQAELCLLTDEVDQFLIHNPQYMFADIHSLGKILVQRPRLNRL